jgi:hypothetical protein
MPYEHYAENPETGEYYGWNGREWITVHPREVPGTVANQALQRQPRMRAATRQAQRDANPPVSKRLADIAGGVWDTTGRSAIDFGKQMMEERREHPIRSLIVPAATTVLAKGIKHGVETRAADMGTAIDEENYLRAAGDAIAIGTAPVGGTAFADIADTARDNPERALGQALGVAGMFVAPKAVQAGMERTGPLGRSLQRAGAERAALATGARRLPDLETLFEVDDVGRPRGPIVDLLDSPEGMPVAMTQKGLRSKLVARDKSAGAAVGETKSAVQPGQYVLDQSMVDQTLLKSIDTEIAKRTNTVGGQPSARPDGRPLGRTTADTTAIDNLEAAKRDILSSIDPATGKLDLADLFGKIDTWDDVYNSARVQAGGRLDVTSRAFTDKMAADAIRRTLADNIPELADVNREFHAVRTTRDMLESKLGADAAASRLIGPRGMRYLAYLVGGSGALGGAGMAVAGGAAALEAIWRAAKSTPVRTWSANRLYQFGKFLEAGELDSAARIAETAAAEVSGATGRPASPPPTAGTATATGGAGGGPTLAPASSGGARRMPVMADDLVPRDTARTNPVSQRLSPVDPYREVSDLFDRRNALIADEAGKAVEAGNANLVLKDVATARNAQRQVVPARVSPASPPSPTSTPARPPAIPRSASDVLDTPTKGAIVPKRLPKLDTTPADPAAPRVDYSTMDEATLKTKLDEAVRARDSSKRAGAGTRSLMPLEQRIRDIQTVLRIRDIQTVLQTAQPTERQRRPGVNVEWPKDPNSRDENADYFLRNPPSRDLPERFRNGRRITYGTPITKQITFNGQPDPLSMGLFGRPFDPRPGPLPRNTALIAAQARDEPATYAHETFHSIYAGDLTPSERTDFKRIMDPIFAAHSKEVGRLLYPTQGRSTLNLPQASLKAAENLKLPRVAVYGQLYATGDPEAKYDEAFSELGGQYMLNPTAFKSTYPEIYNWYKRLIGREYIGVSKSSAKPMSRSVPKQQSKTGMPSKSSAMTTIPIAPATAAPTPRRVTASRGGRRIEGVEVRSFNTSRGRAIVLRADDKSERLVFENEVSKR